MKFSFLKTSADKGCVVANLDRMQKQAAELDMDSFSVAYTLNEGSYCVAKSYYQKRHCIYPLPLITYKGKAPALQELEFSIEQEDSGYTYAEYFGILEDIKFNSKEKRDCMQEYNVELQESQGFDPTNIIDKAYDCKGNIFEYIGRFSGYLLQYYGADSAYLFCNKQLRKAVMCFEYT